MYSAETVTSFLNRARLRLDQELDNQTNFWSDAEMLEYMNEGMREVWQSVRENHQNWFMRQVTSRDGVLTIGSKNVDGVGLAQARRTEIAAQGGLIQEHDDDFLVRRGWGSVLQRMRTFENG